MGLLPYLTQAQSLLLQDINVVDVETGELLSRQDVWLDGERIAAMAATGSENRLAADTLRLSGYYLTPGLVDGHIHHFQSGGLYTRPDVIDLREYHPYEKELSWLRSALPSLWRRYLAAGITSTVDLGGPLSNYVLRAQADSLALTPLTFVTGPLLSSYQPAELTTDDPPILKIDSPEAGRAAVQAQLALKPDYIKIWYIVQAGESPATFFPIAQAICVEAHAVGLPVAVHATQLETARKAVEAGADYLVHSVDDAVVDSSFVQLLLQRGVYYCPTLTVSHSYEEVLYGQPDLHRNDWRLGQAEVIGSLWTLPELPPEIRPAWVDRLLASPLPEDPEADVMATNLSRLAQAGVPIITGTDAGNIGTLHAGSYFEELMAMQGAGLSPAEILRASTLHPAQMLGDSAGRVQPGYRADLLVLRANPLDFLAPLQEPSLVIRQGQVYRPGELIDRSDEEVLTLWLSAWKLGDEAAMELLTHPAVTLSKGSGRWVGRRRVTMLMGNQVVPAGIPQVLQQRRGWLVQWGEGQMMVEIREGQVFSITR